VVPGVTSAFAGPLAAGVSVTGRGVASGVCVVTAHQDPASEPIDWNAVASSGLTVVVLMGAGRAAMIRDLLVGGGRPADTPTAVVTNATLADQRTWFGPLAALGREPVAAPSVLVIGTAVANRCPQTVHAMFGQPEETAAYSGPRSPATRGPAGR